ncbi:MAG: ATP-binding protein [Anaerolineaceae bacterium]|nr:ATP-binding protein [Anaerolineaceae bacterium]
MANQSKQLVVLSGKGGTGKTSISAALAYEIKEQMQQPLVLIDADVDAANLALLLHPEIQNQSVFCDAEVAQIDAQACTACGICLQTCRYDAIIEGQPYSVDGIACEGCGACVFTCPEQAISLHEESSGFWFKSESLVGPMLHAELDPGGENSGKLVALLKQQGVQAAREINAVLMLVDGPPGTGCPAIAACSGTDLALLVTEPGLAAFHDLKRITATARHFNMPCVLCINKADINLKIKEEIVTWAEQESIPVLAEINFDEKMIECVMQGQIITQAYPQSKAAQQIKTLWTGLGKSLSI